MKLKEKLYLNKIDSLISIGLEKGLIEPFDDSFYEELNKTIISGIPVDIDIKYLKPVLPPGKCYDRSLKMFLAMEESLLVRGSIEYFRVFGDNSKDNHGWVERDNYVYDPTWLYRFNKKYYYKIFKVKNEQKCNSEEYCNQSIRNKRLYDKVKNTTRDTLKKDNADRFQLILTIPLLEGITLENDNFREELIKYLKEIDYNEMQINNSINREFVKINKQS